ncbi:hypothetical protein Q3G72_017711 [Acer saccharum]|nr:hypothetical protein Q3G72_017711 [Acer saccharum]
MNILQRLISNNYEFTFHEFFEGKYGAKYCSVCCEVICGPAYIAEEDGGNSMHKSCAELPAYVCFPCKLFIHESCFDTIPERINSSFHPQHPLLQRSIISTTAAKEPRYCQACGERVEGIELRCQKCKYSFHVSCGKRTTPGLTLDGQEHKLFYLDYWDHSGDCSVCKNPCEGGAAICRCIQRGENFHINCILPHQLKHESHDHDLTLTNSVVPRCNPDEYHCDVCETKGDIKRHVYHCEECYYIAHIECVLAEASFIERHQARKKTKTPKEQPQNRGNYPRHSTRQNNAPSQSQDPTQATKTHRATNTNQNTSSLAPAHLFAASSTLDQDPPLKMILKSKDDSEQQSNDNVQEVEAKEHIEKMEEAKDVEEINESEESDDDDPSEESDDDDHQSEESSDESEKKSDEEQKTKKLNKLAQDVKGKIDKLTFKLKRIEEKLEL